MKTIRTLAFVLALLLGMPRTGAAQDSEEAVMASLKGLHDITQTNVLKTAEMISEDLYAYRPTVHVRTAGQILAHIANAQFLFCSSAAGDENPNSQDYEETATTKTEIVAALKEGFDYCAGVYASMSDEEGAVMKDFFGNQMAASAILAFNSAHNFEHYGNLVTYMRLNGITPPSSM